MTLPGQGNPPSCQKFAMSTTRQASSWTVNLCNLRRLPCTKSWYILIICCQSVRVVSKTCFIKSVFDIFVRDDIKNNCSVQNSLLYRSFGPMKYTTTPCR